MSAEIIQFVPKPNLNRERIQRELEKEAAAILEQTGYAAQKLTYGTVPYGGAGIDGMNVEPERT